jgi:rhodanese-related sulfurtransferase
MKPLTINQKFIVVALVLAAVAVVGPDPYARSYAKVDVKALSLKADQQADRVEVLDLAEKLIAGTQEYRLIDLRSAEAYAAASLPGAENLSVQDFLKSADLKDANVLLYSKDDMQAAQAWVLAKSTGYKSVRIVAGGLKAWNDEVLYPTLATASTPAAAQQLERRKFVSLHFGGAPKLAGGTAMAVPASTAQVAKPAAGKAPAAGGAPKKKREGC